MNIFERLFHPCGDQTRVIQLLEIIMATLKEVQDALTQAALDATAEKEEVAIALKKLSDQVTALQAQIANGAAVTSADLDGLVAQIQGIDAQVKDITVPEAPATPAGGPGEGGGGHP